VTRTARTLGRPYLGIGLMCTGLVELLRLPRGAMHSAMLPSSRGIHRRSISVGRSASPWPNMDIHQSFALVPLSPSLFDSASARRVGGLSHTVYYA